MAHKPRKKIPKTIAIINADNCTGCQSCIEVCPVDCIELLSVENGIGVKGTQEWCQIDIERCISCENCIHVPVRGTIHDLKVCPWDAIELHKTETVAQVIAEIGGPPEYMEANWDRLVGSAQAMAESYANGNKK